MATESRFASINGLEWCLAFLGIQLAGAIAVPVNTRFSESEAEYVINDSGSKFVCMPSATLPEGPPLAVDDIAHADVSAIFYTSGTTGFPKGAMTTHEGFLSNIETCARVVPLPKDGSVQNAGLGPAVPRHRLQQPAPAELRQRRRDHHHAGLQRPVVPRPDQRGTHQFPYFGPRDLLARDPAAELSRTSTPKASAGSATAARPPLPTWSPAFSSRSPTRASATDSASPKPHRSPPFLPHEFARVRPETVGFAAPVVDLKLGDVSGDVGELLIRGPNIVKGYWQKPEATAEAFAGGWLHSGDLARLDADGFVQIVDRKKDMVNRGGENVYCVEVENALAAHPSVFEVAVMGVPDTMMGEKVGAVVVVRPGETLEARDLLDLRPRAPGRFQNPSVRRDPRRAFSPQSGR